MCIPAAEAFTWIASFDGCITSADVSKANVSFSWCLTGVAPGNVTCAKSFCWPFTRGAARIGLPRMPGILSFSISCTCTIFRKEAHTRKPTQLHVMPCVACSTYAEVQRQLHAPKQRGSSGCRACRHGQASLHRFRRDPSRKVCVFLLLTPGQNCRITVLAFIQTVKPGPSRYQEGIARRPGVFGGKWCGVHIPVGAFKYPEGIARCSDVRPRAGAKESVRCCHVRGIVRA